ncbi:oxygenase MpaB family protein [Pseudomonas sichuanensis]|uniref:oxygenase MpaB family protein n=1 Tax=Pseudomonas TaxID=286 RepID=UPI00129B8808|nr:MULTISPECIES: oxygenase MpaB family protein [Pseudomonas]MDH0732611.1 oxygenase MpaB family protein [Pseudomonas sichuanensis]MDH1583087.1 oxygenase MpaB family protein [Pseudomonas sichuanensis]MDH1594701.1 oxygenase MpaB family protein [Pseudomonas sichuanensis]MDH1598269.1 oxygenase MpaB family protein [Pseudomonas sichuanensis]MDU9404803.1 oxygenase MpaB family protein [Pseudomonas sp. zfem004]
MEALRRRIETQVMSLTGLALGQLDLETPKGDPGLFGPQSISWQVHGDFPSMLVGGISALMLQLLHPLALAGVWDHSNFREDLLGRLRRTSQFISGTTFGSTRDAEWLIDKVRTIHLKVVGTAADGRPYAASDPDLLTWVHVAEVSSFLAAHLRYRNPGLPRADQDAYYNEIALIAERLGARDVPRSCRQIEDYLQHMRPQLLCDARSLEVIDILFKAPAPSRLAEPVGKLMLKAGADLLPGWAQQMLGLQQSLLARRLIRLGLANTAPVLRWAMRDGSAHRARRRMGIE